MKIFNLITIKNLINVAIYCILIIAIRIHKGRCMSLNARTIGKACLACENADDIQHVATEFLIETESLATLELDNFLKAFGELAISKLAHCKLECAEFLTKHFITQLSTDDTIWLKAVLKYKKDFYYIVYNNEYITEPINDLSLRTCALIINLYLRWDNLQATIVNQIDTKLGDIDAELYKIQKDINQSIYLPLAESFSPFRTPAHTTILNIIKNYTADELVWLYLCAHTKEVIDFSINTANGVVNYNKPAINSMGVLAGLFDKHSKNKIINICWSLGGKMLIDEVIAVACSI